MIMGKLIQLKRAAEQLGMTRQTLLNWNDRGVIKIHKVGRMSFVSSDFIDSFSESFKDLEKSDEILRQKKKEVLDKTEQLEDELRQLRKDFNVLPMLENAFQVLIYKTLANVLGRDKEEKRDMVKVVEYILSGHTIKETSEETGLTRYRVRDLILRMSKGANNIIDFNSMHEDIKKLREENEYLKEQYKVAVSEIHRKEKEMEGVPNLTREQVQFIHTQVELLPLSARCVNALLIAKYKTVADILQKPKNEIYELRRIGKKTIDELTDYIESHGLSFGMNIDKAMEKYLTAQ